MLPSNLFEVKVLVTSHISAEETETSSDIENRLMVIRGRRGGES